MNLRWIYIILLSLQIARAVSSSSKKELIPGGTKIFIDEGASEHEEVAHSRQRRVGPEPLEMSTTVKDTVNTPTSSAVMNQSMNETKSTTSEAKDMEETSVSPKDDEDSTLTTPKNLDKSSSVPTFQNITDINAKVTKEEIVKALESTTTTVSPVKVMNDTKFNMTLSSIATTSTIAPEVLPKNASKFDEAAPEIQERLKQTEYNVTDSGKTNVTVTPDTTTPLYEIIYENSTKNPVNVTLKSEEETLEKSNVKILDDNNNNNDKSNKNEKTGMPSGIVALIIAIAFAVFAVIGYAGMMVWKRYLEYRYGNRELLVNDFDANDINNFEL